MTIYMYSPDADMLRAMLHLLDATVREWYNLPGCKLDNTTKHSYTVKVPCNTNMIRSWNYKLCRLHRWNNDEDTFFEIESYT